MLFYVILCMIHILRYNITPQDIMVDSNISRTTRNCPGWTVYGVMLTLHVFRLWLDIQFDFLVYDISKGQNKFSWFDGTNRLHVENTLCQILLQYENFNTYSFDQFIMHQNK